MVDQHARIAAAVFLFVSSFAGILRADPPPGSPRPTTRPVLPERHSIDGIVHGADGHGIQAVVFILNAETGIPYSNTTDHPFVDGDGGTRVLRRSKRTSR
jgi:hypothetical protein